MPSRHVHLPRHDLAAADLASIAADEVAAELVDRLAAAERSKHTLLLEGLRRQTADRAPAHVAAIIGDASEVLARAQARDPGVVADVLVLPHVGAWAVTCLSRRSAVVGSPSAAELGYFAQLAVVAAVRTGIPFDLPVPAPGGVLDLPTLGRLRLDSGGTADWARIRSSPRESVVSVTAGAGTVEVPIASTGPWRHNGAEWLPAERLRLQADGVALNVLLDGHDPFLGEMYRAVTVLHQPAQGAWHRLLESAWHILVRQHRSTAEAFASAVTTLVPLREPIPGRAVSATSGHAWGAIALSLPPDPVSGAETFVHELRHLVLAAVEDIAPLVHHRGQSLLYAPWRDDPRPLPSLLHGSYAFFGVTAFWRQRGQQRDPGAPADALRGAVEFARRRREVRDATRQVAGSAELTKTGRMLARGMLRRLDVWAAEPVPPQAEVMAVEMSAEHRLRWRLANLSPSQDAVNAMAQAWLDGSPVSWPAKGLAVTLAPSTQRLTGELAQLLRLRLRDPEQLGQLPGVTPTDIDAAHAAFIQGDDVAAWRLYMRCAASGNYDAWVGLLLVRRRRAGLPAGATLTERPEIIVALYNRVHALTGVADDAEPLIQWLDALDAEPGNRLAGTE